MKNRRDTTADALSQNKLIVLELGYPAPQLNLIVNTSLQRLFAGKSTELFSAGHQIEASVSYRRPPYLPTIDTPARLVSTSR